MHVAICMDVAADRKQLERLLGRSIDRRLKIDENMPIYVQSYGNKEALLSRPFMYDLFFIDLLNDTTDSVQLIRQLRRIGVKSTIVLCPSTTDLSDQLLPEDDVIVLKQPFIADELEMVMDKAVEYVKCKVPTLEIRTITETVHIDPKDFLYAEKKKDVISINLVGGKEIISTEKLNIFFERAVNFGNIYYLPDYLVVNEKVVQSVGLLSVKLTNGSRYKVSRKWLKYFVAHTAIKN